MWNCIKKNWRMLLLAAVAICAGLMAGLAIGLSIPGEESARTVDRIGSASVLPTTDMERRLRFTGCGHSIRKELDTEAFIGYTKEELQSFYQGDTVLHFDGESVVLEHTYSCCCPEHYQLKLNEKNELCVYRTDPHSYRESLQFILPKDASEGFSEETLSALKSGILLDTMADIDGYLESLGS